MRPPGTAPCVICREGGQQRPAFCLAAARACIALVLQAGLFVCVLTGRAHAYGAVFSSADQPLVQTVANVLLIDKAGPEMAAVIQLELTGPSQPFVWLLPVPSAPTVKVSSSKIFDRLATASTPEYWAEVFLGDACPMKPDGGADEDPYADGGIRNPSSIDLGPYGDGVSADKLPAFALRSYELLEVDDRLSDPTQALIDWLTREGFDTRSFEREAWRAYLEDGYRVLAARYEGTEERGTTQPLVVTYTADTVTLPWRVTAASAVAEMPLSVWVLGPAQAVPQNYVSLVLNDALLDWQKAKHYPTDTLPAAGSGPLYGTPFEPPDNYRELIAAAVREAEGGLVTEVAIPASSLRELLWSPADRNSLQALRDQVYEDGVDLLSALAPFRSWDGFSAAVAGATTLGEGVTLKQLLADPESYRGQVSIDTDRLLKLVDELVIEPVTQTAELLYEAPYLTRLATTLGAAPLLHDAVFGFNADLALNHGVHFAHKYIDCAAGQDSEDARWQFDLPQGGVVVGSGSDWPLRIGALPATLKVVQLSSQGSGEVIIDHSNEIGAALFKAAGMTGSGVAVPKPPTSGVPIGATHSVLPEDDAPAQSSRDAGCSVVAAGRRGPLALPWMLALLVGICACARLRRAALLAGMLLGLGAYGCGGDGRSKQQGQDAGVSDIQGALTREQLRDPQTCKTCHPKHYEEWSASMHAYAAKDPVFLAMNRRGQRETKGKLGDLCVRCHAPMAVADGLTKDGLNLEQLPDLERGVSCYYCHNVVSIEDDHNGKLTIANDTTMRGPIENPLRPIAHRAEYSAQLEGRKRESTAMCGSCHDIVMQSGVHLERTFQEYRHGVYSKTATGGEPEPFDSCAGCHMPPRTGVAAEVEGAPPRELHEHLWPGIDVALIDDFPHREAMRSAVEDCQLGVPSIPFFTLEVTPPDLFTFQIETGAGHNQPSGASQDRRMWIEFLAYDADGELIREASSGLIADDEIEDKSVEEPGYDPRLVIFRDYIFKANGKPAHMFWDAAKSAAYPLGYKSQLLPVASSTYAEGGHAVLKQYRAASADGSLPARVTARLKIRPIGQDVLQDLVASGDLDAKIAARMPTFTFGAKIDWTPNDGVKRTIRADVTSDCETYRCLLSPQAPQCK